MPRRKKLLPEKALEMMGEKPSPKKVTAILNQMSVKGQRKLRRLLREKEKRAKQWQRTMRAATWRAEQGEKSKQFRYMLPLSKDGKYSVVDMSVGLPMGDRSILLIVLYRLLEGGYAYDMRQWLTQEDGRFTPTKRGVFVKVDETVAKQIADELVRLHDQVSRETLSDQEG